MLNQEAMLLMDTYRRLIRRDAKVNIEKMIQKTHAVDMAWLFRYFSSLERAYIFRLIRDKTYLADLLSELDEAILNEMVQDINPRDLADLIREMALDDRADFLSVLPEELSQKIMDYLSAKDTYDVEELMKYPEDSAGGLMIPDPFVLNENLTVKEAISALQESEKKEMVFYIYVVDDRSQLVGVLSLRQLLTVPPQTKLKNIMITRVVSVLPETDQEEVARIASRYDFLAIPVVDNENKLLGIVTVDDIIDVIREEATEDFLQMAGVGKDKEILFKSPVEAARVRFPWLFATFVGGLVVSAIVIGFKDILDKFVILAAFMPIIGGMGGNVGAQSYTPIVRGLATGRINIKHILKVLFDQMKIGLILGIIYGVLLGGFALAFYHGQYDINRIGITIGVALISELFIAASLGTLIPMILHRFSIDPAIATGPIIQTLLDITGVAVYFTIASTMLT